MTAKVSILEELTAADVVVFGYSVVVVVILFSVFATGLD